MRCEDWTMFKVKSLSSLGKIVTGRTPSTASGANFGGEVPFVTPRDLTGQKTIRETERYLTPRGVAKVKAAVIPAGAIMVSCIGSDMGKVAVAAKDCVTNQQINSIVVEDPEVSPEYLYYLLSTLKSYLLHLGAGATAIPILNKTNFSALRFKFPPLPEQKRIAHILGSLDDKIELNRQMNKTLEAMAQALFKSWFIDFDPVRAKMEGRDPSGMDPQTAALFPDQLVESELGPIPKGWEVGKIAEIIQITPRYQLSRGDVAPYLGMADAPEEGHFPHGWYDREFNGSGSKFKNGDTLMAKITPCLENGKTAFVDFLPEDTIGWGSTEYLVLRSKPPFPLEYSYYLARSRPIRQRAIQSMTGSSGRQRVPVRAFRDFLIVIPPPDIAERFGTNVRKLMNKIRKNHEESRTMTLVRDMLLPELLCRDVE